MGFTLVELLVAMAIGTILTLSAFTVISQGSEGYNRMSSKTKTRTEAREGLTQMARDFSSFQVGHLRWVKDNSSSWRKDEVRFLTRLPLSAQDKNEASNSLCRITYIVATDSLNGSVEGVTQSLYRHTEYSESVTKTLTTGGSFSSERHPLDEMGLMIYDVLSFHIDFFIRLESGVLVEWTEEADQSPDSAKITLQVVNDPVAARLVTESDWQKVTSPLGPPDDVFENGIEGVETYTLTLSLNSDD